MPRYVILEHNWPHRHWDLMLECDGVLKTWRLSEPPTADHLVQAEAIGDHRLAYLDYEGEVSGGRGTVKRWDAGEFDWSNTSNELAVAVVRGSQLEGVLQLDNDNSQLYFLRQ